MSDIHWINTDDYFNDDTPPIDVEPQFLGAKWNWLDNPTVTMQHPDQLLTWPAVRIGGPLYRAMIARGWTEVKS